jgi:hypothetical protein
MRQTCLVALAAQIPQLLPGFGQWRLEPHGHTDDGSEAIPSTVTIHPRSSQKEIFQNESRAAYEEILAELILANHRREVAMGRCDDANGRSCTA